MTVAGDPSGAVDAGQQADHGAHRMPHEDHGALREFVDDLQHVVRIAVERGVFAGIVGAQVGQAAAHLSKVMVRQRAA